jgi:hypothetical protein
MPASGGGMMWGVLFDCVDDMAPGPLTRVSAGQLVGGHELSAGVTGSGRMQSA